MGVFLSNLSVFKIAEMMLSDDSRRNCPSTSKSDDNIKEIDNLI